MAIRLEKGQRINLEKESGAKLTRFMVGCNWGALKTGRKIEVIDKEGFLGFGRKTHIEDEEIDLDIDLSCVMVDANGKLVDALYSPLYNANIYPNIFSKIIPGLPKGADWSKDKSMFHTPDDALSLQKNTTQSHKLQNDQGKTMIAKDSFVPLL